ncbi:protein transport protein Sec31A isoform X2 [Chironomus tepperi]|uniref:protein transport protein Sec31A isoform X2 n=1 Tax=Chironomus tepperi TaxID=113505 RepID=UPI00391FCA6D
MKIKELQKSVNVAWSPETQDRILLAAGSAAQQLLDTSFNSSNPLLELYSLNLSDTSYDLELVGSQQSDHKFHKLVWTPFDNSNQFSNGLIVGGCESGYLKIYNVSKILAGEDALVAQSNKHTGPVRTLDYNPFKTNLIASATSESEIFIWDVNNTSVPMTPGQKTQPLEDVCGIAWNLQVQHILASTFATRCVVWDLRKNEPIIKLSDSQSRVRWRAVNWHPDIATQLWLASEDDQTPVIQLWDLRYATAPSKTLQIHSRGVLGMALCPKDTELMISCAKDNKILCWNTSSEDNHGEILSEIASTSSWYSDITWCPKNPALVAASSFDGNVSVYSLFGGAQQQVQTSNKIADSFPGMESIPQEYSTQTAAHAQIFHDLKRPPKWFKRPSGISFGFGGKFVTFNGTNKTVEIKQLITDESLVKKSTELENVLAQGNYVEYCRQKADDSSDQHKRYIWYFLKAYFEENPTSEFLNLLGYHSEDIASKFNKFVDDKDTQSNAVDGVTNQMAQLNRNQDGFDMNGLNESTAGKIPYKLSTSGSEGLICEALLTGNIAAAVELCMNAGRSTDAIILASLGGSDLLAKTQYRYLKNNDSFISNLISAMVMADWSGVISQCTIDSWKEALVAALTHSKDQSNLLCERLGERMQMESGGDLSIIQDSILCYICAGNIERIVDAWCTINGHDSLDDSGKLQELIEIVILLNKGMERHGQNIPVYGRYAELLSKYASLLAAQGSLEMALTYVGTSCDDPHIVDLRERLYYALGHKNQSNVMQQRQRTVSGFGQNYQTGPRLSHPRTVSTSSTGMPTSTFNPVLPNSTPNVMPPTTFNTGLPNSGMTNNYVDPMSQMWSQNQVQPQLQQVPKPPTFMNPLENVPQPPRPASVSSVSSQSNTTSGPPKPKRLLDPSVQSNAGYGQMPPSAPYNPNPQFNTNPIQPAFNTQPINQMPLQTQPQMMSSWDQQNVYGYQNNNNAMNGNLAPPPMPQQALKNPTPPPGWNDPPEFKPKSQFISTKSDMSAVHAGTKKWLQKHSDGYSNSSSTSCEVKKDVSVAAPIMHPIFGASDPNQVPPANNMMNPAMLNPAMPGQNQYDQSYGTSQPPTQMQPAAPMNIMNPTNFYQPQQQQQPQMQDNSNMINYQNFNSFVGAPQQQQQQQEMPVKPPVQEVVKEKPPLPEEFIYLQTVLEELKTQCINRATNPQMKRKLDDVSRRLESLYDLLRDNRLSTNTLESLNQMVQLIQIGDYANCLGLHTQMVSGPEFAKIATFMPGMKILIQLAIQLQVFLR